jgi:hypothetical protein
MGFAMSNKIMGWETRLIEYLQGVSVAPFKPGKLDCGLFFAGGVKAMTGKDYAKKLRGKYKRIDDGIALLNDMGFADHIDYTASLFNEVPPLMAQRGDGAVVPGEADQDALGIVQGDRIYCMTLTGLSLFPLTMATRAFRV